MREIYINGNIITVDKKKPKAEAFIVENGIFVKVGTNEEIIKAKSDDDTVISLQGKTILPGFNDSHVHLLNYGYSLTKLNCNDFDSIEELIEKSKKYINDSKIPRGAWVLGRGWNQAFFKEQRVLTKDDLDKISIEHPIVFTRVCEHMIVVNSKALQMANITSDTPNPEGGEIEKDENKQLTGMLKETARYMVYNIMPEKSIEEIKEMLVKGIEKASEFGITSVQTDDFETFSDKNWRKVLRAYDELIKEGRLNVRVYEQCLLPNINRLNEFIREGYITGKGNEYFKIGPLKLLTDGSLGGRTAYLSRPYSDEPNTNGIPVFTQDELDELIIAAHTNNIQIACHAIGDAAMHMVFESFDKAQEIKPDKNARMGIVHVQITDKVLLEKFKEKNIIAYVEPICIASDLHIAVNRVGMKRIKTSYNYRTLYDMGVITPMSSDCPVDSLNPIDSIYVGVNRKDYSGNPKEGWMANECLTVEQMIEGFTIMSAYASFEEKIKGSIEEGKLADFIILSEDITIVSAEKIRDIKVHRTYLGGKLIYERY